MKARHSAVLVFAATLGLYGPAAARGTLGNPPDPEPTPVAPTAEPPAPPAPTPAAAPAPPQAPTSAPRHLTELSKKEMAQRIKANRSAIANYALPAASAAGVGGVQVCNQATQAARDMCEWGNLLRGATEVAAGGTRVGAMSDARGCLLPLPAATAASAVNVVVVWRGVSPSETNAAAPCVPAGYVTTDGLMRYTSTVVGFGALKP